jgi:hypothetical protein
MLLHLGTCSSLWALLLQVSRVAFSGQHAGAGGGAAAVSAPSLAPSRRPDGSTLGHVSTRLPARRHSAVVTARSLRNQQRASTPLSCIHQAPAIGVVCGHGLLPVQSAIYQPRPKRFLHQTHSLAPRVRLRRITRPSSHSTEQAASCMRSPQPPYRGSARVTCNTSPRRGPRSRAYRAYAASHTAAPSPATSPILLLLFIAHHVGDDRGAGQHRPRLL